jgi:O-antigen ligase
MMVVVPVIFDPRSLDRVNLPKLTAALIGALTIVAIWVVEAVRSGPSPTWRNGLHWPALALVSWTAITTATSVNPRLSLLGDFNSGNGLLAAGALVVIFFSVVQTVSMERVKAVLSLLFLGGGGLAVLYGLFQLHDRLLSGPRWDWVRPFSSTIYSTFGNPNHFAAFLSVLVPVGCLLFVLHKSSGVRVGIVAVMAGVLVQLLHTASRGALLATLAGLAVAGALTWSDMRQHRKTLLTVGAAVVAVLAVGGSALAAHPQFSGKLSSGIHVGATLELRTDLWKLGLAVANARPLLGQGRDTWIDSAPKYQDAETARRYGPEGYYSNGAHNMFVGEMASSGYPGLALLLALLLYATMRAVGAWRRLRQSESAGGQDGRSRAREARFCLVAVLAGLVAYVVQASFNIAQIGLDFVFWVLLGLLCVLSMGAGVPSSLRPRVLVRRPIDRERGAVWSGIEASGRTPHCVSSGLQPSGTNRVTAAIAVLSCAALAIAVSLTTRPLRASHSAWAARGDLAAARRSPPDEAIQLSRRAATRLTNATSLNSWEANHLFSSAEALLNERSGRSRLEPSTLRMARHLADEAIKLRPHNSLHLERHATVLLRIDSMDQGGGDARAQAVRSLQRAVTANPYSTRLQQRLRSLVQ